MLNAYQSRQKKSGQMMFNSTHKFFLIVYSLAFLNNQCLSLRKPLWLMSITWITMIYDKKLGSVGKSR